MTIRELHEQAMALMDAALVHRQREEPDEALSCFRRAFETENQAATEAVRLQVAEPTRSVLLRSAACLAFDCSRWREAENSSLSACRENRPNRLPKNFET